MFWNQGLKFNYYIYIKRKESLVYILEWPIPANNNGLWYCRDSIEIITHSSVQRYFKWVEYKSKSIDINSGISYVISTHEKTQWQATGLLLKQNLQFPINKNTTVFLKILK